MTFAEMKTDVFRRLREVSAAPVFFSEDDIDTALNDGLMELSDATEWYERYLTVDVLADRPYYDCRTVIGDSLLSIGPAYNDDTSRWLIPTSLRELDEGDQRWEQRRMMPDRIYTRGLWWVSYWPRQTSDTGTIKQYFTALPPQMSEDTDTPGFPVEFHRGCVEFALTDLWAQDAETTFALEAWATYLQIEAQLQAWVSERLGVPQMRGYGDDAQ